MMALQHGRHWTSRNVAPAFDDLGPIAGKHQRRCQLVILIPIGYVGTRIWIDLQKNILGLQQEHDNWIAVVNVIHHMTPVAPDRFKVQQDKLMLLPGLRKRGIRPRLPLAAAKAARLPPHNCRTRAAMRQADL